MKRNLLIIVILLISFNVKAQINVSYSVGYGSYKMSDMKDIAEMVLDQAVSNVGVPLKLTDNFPGYIIHSGELTYQLRKHEFGLNGAYMTTGAKYAYSDYSGKYNSKILVDAYKIGLVYKYHFFETRLSNNPFSLFLELNPSAVFTDAKVKDYINLYEQNITEDQTENLLSDEFGFSIQPMLGCRVKILDHLTFHLGAGYDFEFATKVNPLQRVDWSGFRLKGGFGCSF